MNLLEKSLMASSISMSVYDTEGGGGGGGGGATASEGQVYMCVPRLLVESLISSSVYGLNFPRSGKKLKFRWVLFLLFLGIKIG